MENLFDIPPEKQKDKLPFPGKHCRDCIHIANLNPHSNRYWHCAIIPSRRTIYGFKAVKRMNNACEQFEEKSKPPGLA